MILIPKYRDIFTLNPVILPIGVSGRFKFEAMNKFSGKRRVLADWFSNVILDSGLNMMGDNLNWDDKCHVGTSNAAVLVTQTALSGFLANSDTVENQFPGVGGTYYGSYTWVFRFNAGTATGNLQEVGIGKVNGGGDPLFSRALILDGGGSPTTLTILADEILDVTYELRSNAPVGDVDSTVTLDSLVYDTKLRAALVTSSTYWGQWMNTQMAARNNDTAAYTGAIGAVTTEPAGTKMGIPGTSVDVTNSAYVNLSLEKEFVLNVPVDDWNNGAGIRCITYNTSLGFFQSSYTRQGGGGETIPKDATKNLDMTCKFAWART